MQNKSSLTKQILCSAMLCSVFSLTAFSEEITFNANSGSGSMSSITKGEAEYVTLPENSFKKSGFSFSGWNTETDGSGIGYSDQRNFFMPGSDLTLHAQWKKSSEPIDTVGKEVVMELLRPLEGHPGPCYIEDFELVVRARHPDGVEKVQINKPGSKIGKPEPPFKRYDSDLGLFINARRFKSAEDRKYDIIITTQKGEVIKSEEVFGDEGWHSINFQKKIPQQQNVVNIKDGDTLRADTPLAIAVHCTDPDGGIRTEVGGHRYPIDDLNGVLSVTLKVDGKEVETKRNAVENIAANETAAESAGFYKFMGVTLTKGSHTLTIESMDRAGNPPEVTSIHVKAE